jgi:hypothetical protein
LADITGARIPGWTASRGFGVTDFAWIGCTKNARL